jgi:cholesterol 7-desaturase
LILGWFWLIDSCKLLAGKVEFIQHCGRDVVVFRGYDEQAYVLNAYCAHIGANLGVGGRVRNVNCIECPFHGWIYDGKTGVCVFVDGEKRIARKFDQYEYADVQRCESSSSTNDRSTTDCLQKMAQNQEIRLQRYECREVNGSIFVWYHSEEQWKQRPQYELFDLTEHIRSHGMESN